MRSIQIQVVQHLQAGGIETMALDFLRLKKTGVDVYVVSLEGTAEDAINNWPRLKPFADKLRFLNKPAGINVLTIFWLARLMRQLKATAVQTHHVGPLLYGGIAAKLAGVPNLVHTEHDAWHLQNPRRRNLQNWLIRLLKPILVADSNIVAKELSFILPKWSYKVIRNGVDCDLFSPGSKSKARAQLGLRDGDTIIGSAGRLEPVKGHSRLLNAHALLPDCYHLVIAGCGSLDEKLKKLATKLGTSARVHFLGRIDDMPNFYRALDVFCLPSDMEGMPLSPLEAQAVGIPCVATDVGGTREALCPDTGTAVPATHHSLLASGLHHVLSHHNTVNPRTYPLDHANLKNVISAYQLLLAPEGSS